MAKTKMNTTMANKTDMDTRTKTNTKSEPDDFTKSKEKLQLSVRVYISSYIFNWRRTQRKQRRAGRI